MGYGVSFRIFQPELTFPVGEERLHPDPRLYIVPSAGNKVDCFRFVERRCKMLPHPQFCLLSEYRNSAHPILVFRMLVLRDSRLELMESA